MKYSYNIYKVVQLQDHSVHSIKSTVHSWLIVMGGFVLHTIIQRWK